MAARRYAPGEVDRSAAVDHLPVDDLHAIAIGAVAGAALGDYQNAPGAVVDGARRGGGRKQADANRGKNASSDKMRYHGGLICTSAGTWARRGGSAESGQLLKPHILLRCRWPWQETHTTLRSTIFAAGCRRRA